MTTQVPNKLRNTALALLGALAILAALRILVPGGPRGDARPALDRPWERREVLGLSLESPGRFRAITIPVPEELRTSIVRMESFGRNEGQTELRVSRIEYRPEVQLSLQGSADGAIQAMRANPAVANLAFSSHGAQVSGVPSVRTTSTFQVQGRPAHGEILTVLRGRTLWQVQVLGPADDVTPRLGRRLLDSAQLSQP
jgi:hypothetical protein